MAFGDFIDAVIEPFAPALAAKRKAARIGLDALRKYDAADTGRKTQGWARPATSADAENSRGIERLRNGARDLTRNSKYASAALRQITANMVGDGIAAQAVYAADPVIQQKAQDEFDRWAESRVDGFGDWYEHQKLTANGMIEGGETLTVWKADKEGPNGRIEGLEGDYLDMSRTIPVQGGGRIIQGVEFDQGGDRVAYWLFDRHPGDVLLPSRRVSMPVPAEHVDHVFERRRLGQTRGVSWFASVAMTLRDIADIEDAVRLKKKVEACLALVLTPSADGGDGIPLTNQRETDTDRPTIETLRPGMILRPPAGTSVSTVVPTSTGDGVDFIRQQLAAVSANLTPYHLMTGDVSQANYSSLRAALLGHWSMLDDWQQNVMVPRLCNPAFERRMKRLALQTGDKRYLDVKATWAMPIRRFVDPVKDMMGEILEIRSGLKLLSKSLAERGINSDDHMKAIATMNKLIDDLGLALETDPRRVTNKGVLQIAAGYLAPGDPSLIGADGGSDGNPANP